METIPPLDPARHADFFYLVFHLHVSEQLMSSCFSLRPENDPFSKTMSKDQADRLNGNKTNKHSEWISLENWLISDPTCDVSWLKMMELRSPQL